MLALVWVLGREIKTLYERDIRFRVIAANQAPDHTTVSRFRKETDGEVEFHPPLTLRRAT